MMFRKSIQTKCIFVAAIAALVLSGASCQYGETVQSQRRDLPPELLDAGTPPDPDLFLPPLADFRTDDDVEVGEIRASLDDGAVPYAEIRRRLILDQQGFTLGDIMVVTLQPDTNGVQHFLRHWFGNATREPVDVGGIEMLRISTQAHDVLAWVGPHFVVVFGRGQEVTDDWLDELALATLGAIRTRS